MLIYNVTVHVEYAIENQWLEYMLNTHIPDVMATRCFLGARMSKLISDQDQGGSSYSIQYSIENEEQWNTYQSQFAPKLQSEHLQKFGTQCLAFRTQMEVIAEFPGIKST